MKAFAVAAAACLLTACGAGSSELPAEQGAQARRATSTTTPQGGVRHVVYSHCGVVSTTVDGALWLADPPLRDDSDNPPAGWDENDTPGVFLQQSDADATFTADTGVTAHFIKATSGANDPAAGCE